MQPGGGGVSMQPGEEGEYAAWGGGVSMQPGEEGEYAAWGGEG